MLSILECPKDWLHLVKTRFIFSPGAFTVRFFWRCCTNSIQHSKLIVKFPYPSLVTLSPLSFSPVCCLALFFAASLTLKPNSCGVYDAGSLKTEPSQGGLTMAIYITDRQQDLTPQAAETKDRSNTLK